MDTAPTSPVAFAINNYFSVAKLQLRGMQRKADSIQGITDAIELHPSDAIANLNLIVKTITSFSLRLTNPHEKLSLPPIAEGLIKLVSIALNNPPEKIPANIGWEKAPRKVFAALIHNVRFDAETRRQAQQLLNTLNQQYPVKAAAQPGMGHSKKSMPIAQPSEPMMGLRKPLTTTTDIPGSPTPKYNIMHESQSLIGHARAYIQAGDQVRKAVHLAKFKAAATELQVKFKEDPAMLDEISYKILRSLEHAKSPQILEVALPLMRKIEIDRPLYGHKQAKRVARPGYASPTI